MSMELSPHGREQESSSEAIAAFEAIALFGDVMMQAFAKDEEKVQSARLVRNVGELLTAMEVSAANRFWHVWGSKSDEEGEMAISSSLAKTNAASDDAMPQHINTYPKKYTRPVVGMMHETMASFQVSTLKEFDIIVSIFFWLTQFNFSSNLHSYSDLVRS